LPSDQSWIAIKDVLVFEEYEFLDQFKLTSLPSDAKVVDVGAFAGLYSLKASPFAKRVLAFEPSKRNYAFLEWNIKMNGIQNVQPLRLALWSTEGKSGFTEASSVSHLGGDADYIVDTTTVDELVERLGHIDLLKMDIEGAEYDVISSNTFPALESIDRIVAEVHFYLECQKRRLTELQEILRTSGFHVKVLPSHFQGAYYGLTKPWRCSLRSSNGRNPLAYRLFLSMAYGGRPFVSRLSKALDTGSAGLLFAYR